MLTFFHSLQMSAYVGFHFQVIVFKNYKYIISSKLKHSSNIESPILVTLAGIVILFKFSQPKNAPNPILITPSGITTVVKLSQLANALSPILITPSQLANALSPIPVTPSGKITFAISSSAFTITLSMTYKPFSI